MAETADPPAAASGSEAPALITYFAVDVSGSVGHQPHYFATMRYELEAVERTTDAAALRIVLWDHTVMHSTPAYARKIIEEGKGYGGTVPLNLILGILAQRRKEGTAPGTPSRLVLITDGQISAADVAKCDTVMERYAADLNIVSAKCIIVQTCPLRPNMSVVLPFVRGCRHEIELIGKTGNRLDGYRMDDTSLTLAKIDGITTLAELEPILPDLEAAVAVRMMGRSSDPQLRDKILAMRSRLGAEIAARAQSLSKNKLDLLMDTLRAEMQPEARPEAAGQFTLAPSMWERALAIAQEVAVDYYVTRFGGNQAARTLWSRTLDRLVSMTTGALKGDMDVSQISGALQRQKPETARVNVNDLLHSMTVAVARAEADEGEGDAAPGSEGAASGSEGAAPSFECPVTLDLDQPCVLVHEGPAPILPALLSRAEQLRVVSCPLMALRIPALVDALVAAVDHPVGVAALAEMKRGTMRPVSPMTRRKVVRGGGLCLGDDAAHAAATDWTLAHILNGGKRAGNPTLWLAVLRTLVATDDRLAYLRPLLPHVDNQLRVRAAKPLGSTLSLSTNPELLGSRGPLSLALWMVEHWPLVADAGKEDAGRLLAEPQTDLARAHQPYMREIWALADMLRGGSSPSPAALQMPLHPMARFNVARVSAAMILLGWVKREPAKMRNCVLSLVRPSVHLPSLGIRLPVEGWVGDLPSPPEEVLADQLGLVALLPWLETDGLTAGEALADLATEVDPGKSGKEVRVQAIATADLARAVREKVAARYGLTRAPRFPLQCTDHVMRIVPEWVAPICDATCRPYTYDRVSGLPWWNAADRLLPETPNTSTAARFGDYVLAHERYPTRDQLAAFVYDRFTRPGERWEESGVAVRNGKPSALMLPPRRFAFDIEETMMQFAGVMERVEPAEFARRFNVSRPRAVRARMDRSYDEFGVC